MNQKSLMRLFILFSLFGAFVTSCGLFQNESGIPINENIWVNAYLASWQHNPQTAAVNNGVITTDEIDWTAITHLTYLGLIIGPDGEPAQNFGPTENFNDDRLRSIVPAAHQNNVKVLFSVGGTSNYEGFSSAIEEENRQQFVSTITNLIATYGFDGVNLSMSPINTSDYQNYSDFVELLSATFDTYQTNNNVRPLLTIMAIDNESLFSIYGNLQQYFDQINIFTINMVRPFRAWEAWHNGALYNQQITFPQSPAQYFPSVNRKVESALDAGIAEEKIGIGINFYGYVWNTVNFMEHWAGWPAQDLSILEDASYAQLAERFELQDAQWDNHARVPYLNLSDPKTFITFENESSVKEKVQYAKVKRLGGVMLWEIGAGFIQNATVFPRDPLLKAVKEQAMTTGGE